MNRTLMTEPNSDMEENLIITLIATLGGFEGIRWMVTAWMNRRTNARKEDASADGMEIQNLLNIINAQSAQIDNQEKRMSARDGKVDFLYSENNKLRSENLELIRQKYELELHLKEIEVKKCDVRRCANRRPPSDY